MSNSVGGPKYSSSGGKLFAYMSVQIADFCKGNLQLLKQQRQQCVIALIATLTLTAHTSIHPQSGGWCLWLRVQRRSCVCSLSWAEIAEFCNSALRRRERNQHKKATFFLKPKNAFETRTCVLSRTPLGRRHK